MHTQAFDFQSGQENFDIKFPAGEALQLRFENAPASGERVLTVGSDRLSAPLIEVTGNAHVTIGAKTLEAVPEGRLCIFNLWQREGGALHLVAEGRFVRRATIAPALPRAPFRASAAGPILLFDGDSVMQNMPGTRIFLEQRLGHKFRFPEGYQNAMGGDSAQKIFYGAPEVTARIERDNTVVLVGPVGANQTPEDDSFEEITSYMEQVFSQYLAAGAIVVAVPTLLDGMGITTQDAKKTALADWVMAFANGGTVSFEGTDHVVSAHAGFHAVDVGGFDRDTMKSDVSHPNALGADYLAHQLAAVLSPLVEGSIYDVSDLPNYLSGAELFQGARAATHSGISGTVPALWEVTRSEGTSLWQAGFDLEDTFEISVSGASDAGTCLISLPAISVNAVTGDVVSFAAEIEIVEGATGLRSVGLIAHGQTAMTLDEDWAATPGVYHLRTPDLPYAAAQTTQNFQIALRVAAGASLTVRFHRALAFFVENTAGDVRLSGTPGVSAVVGEAYAFVPVLNGGEAPVLFDLAGEPLPAGLSLNEATGAITGVPTEAGPARGIALRARDSRGETAVLPYFTIEVSPMPAGPSGGAVATWDTTINTTSPFQLEYTLDGTVVGASDAIDGLRHARGAEALSGRCYFECLLGPLVLGIGVATDALTALSGGNFGVGRSFWSGGFLFHTGGNINMGGSFAEGDVVQVALDVDARRLWMRRNGTGDWNNDAGADPAGGVGGLDISGMSGTLYAYAGLQNGASAEVALFGQSGSYRHAAPVGFDPIV